MLNLDKLNINKPHLLLTHVPNEQAASMGIETFTINHLGEEYHLALHGPTSPRYKEYNEVGGALAAVHMGLKVIQITTQLTEIRTSEEIEGVILHELGHLIYDLEILSTTRNHTGKTKIIEADEIRVDNYAVAYVGVSTMLSSARKLAITLSEETKCPRWIMYLILLSLEPARYWNLIKKSMLSKFSK